MSTVLAGQAQRPESRSLALIMPDMVAHVCNPSTGKQRQVYPRDLLPSQSSW